MDGYVVIETELDTKSFDAQIDYVKGQLEDIEDLLRRADAGEEIGKDTLKLESQYETLTNKLKKLVQQKQEFEKPTFSNMNLDLDNIGKSITGIIKKVSRWALAIFGIRSAYMAVRNAINVITQDDKQLKADIDYIKSAFAYALEPVVRKIVELAKQLLFYIGYLIKSWTGKNIFENANKSLKGANTQAQKLQKTLAGFDEMNVLQDTSSSGGGGGAVSPSFDLSNLDNVEVPKWLETIEKIGKWIIDNWQDVVFALLLTKLFIDLLTGNWIGVIIDLVGLLVIAFFKIKDAIKVIWESIKEILAIVGQWIYDNIITPVANFFKNLWDGIKDGVSTAVKWVKDKFKTVVDFFSGLISKIVTLFKNIGTKVGDAIGGAFKAVVNGVLKSIENILNFPIKQINKLLDVINEVPGINIKKLTTFNLPRLAKGGIVNMPGRGVPIGSAYGGERGQEGVIPLTDSQQMALLGEAIGKYININATVPVYVGNRMVAKELKRINAEDDFAYNR